MKTVNNHFIENIDTTTHTHTHTLLNRIQILRKQVLKQQNCFYYVFFFFSCSIVIWSITSPHVCRHNNIVPCIACNQPSTASAFMSSYWIGLDFMVLQNFKWNRANIVDISPKFVCFIELSRHTDMHNKIQEKQNPQISLYIGFNIDESISFHHIP